MLQGHVAMCPFLEFRVDERILLRPLRMAHSKFENPWESGGCTVGLAGFFHLPISEMDVEQLDREQVLTFLNWANFKLDLRIVLSKVDLSHLPTHYNPS